ncbi:MAG: hypothetical protein IQL11_09410 [Bacteroidales bacterium]|nr:hypothetical protein [Bacteroidales bacterium]
MAVNGLLTLDRNSINFYFYLRKNICGNKWYLLKLNDMRIVFLSCILIFVFRVCTAPAVDFRLKIAKLKSLTEFAEKWHHELELTRFMNDLGHRESGNNWTSVNLIGCFGEYQFAESTLRYLGYRKITLKKFRANPNIFPRDVQKDALKVLIQSNMRLLRDYEHFIGDTINGTIITRSGMIAAAHLGGVGTLRKYLNSNGEINKKDVLGTSIHDYMSKFSHYDLKFH